MTKAEEKRTNIQSAIDVFEEWLEQNTSSKSSEKANKSTNDAKEKADTVPGLGFKDKEAALKTLKYFIIYIFYINIGVMIKSL